MTLQETIKGLCNIARQQPAVQMIVKNDIYRLNAAPDVRYGVFAFTQGQHSSSVATGFNFFRFTLFYVDRLTEDNSNELDIQSTGVEVINAVLNEMALENVDVQDYTLQPFTEKFSDLCAGVFASVTIATPRVSECDFTHPDFNKDFNDDFLIY